MAYSGVNFSCMLPYLSEDGSWEKWNFFIYFSRSIFINGLIATSLFCCLSLHVHVLETNLPHINWHSRLKTWHTWNIWCGTSAGSHCSITNASHSATAEYTCMNILMSVTKLLENIVLEYWKEDGKVVHVQHGTRKRCWCVLIHHLVKLHCNLKLIHILHLFVLPQ